ncbi:ABC transporter ATP-binding protein [Peribacillus frigoritolerans]|uniref:ATP-binding cassette domain-containing protein n=1 Tax=Peribacillus frigoritolerans TaxID=450367 RepID=A0AAJ1QLN4_9BACI|nr:ATP-binding cassette domain-containing protein [Peribacillus frigoritolerans]MDM5283809.1 ATP-binding cassette domain-containing protein [Peribacillus frigoritolerans]
MISTPGTRFPRAVREPPRRSWRLWGLPWTRFSRRSLVHPLQSTFFRNLDITPFIYNYLNASGEMVFRGEKLTKSYYKQKRKEIQGVFQNSYASLNPLQKVADILKEPLKNFDLPSYKNELIYLLDTVGLEPSLLQRYPEELSGGQQQRLAIAKAIATKPSIFILDEVTISLDLVLQKKITTASTIAEKQQLSLLFITHDIQVARFIASQILVLDQGEIIEQFSKLQQPCHSLAKQLFQSVLPSHPSKR